MDSATTSTAVAQVEIDNEHGVQKYNWPVSWVEVGEVSDFLPEAGTAYKYGQSQVCADPIMCTCRNVNLLMVGVERAAGHIQLRKPRRVVRDTKHVSAQTHNCVKSRPHRRQVWQTKRCM